MVYCYFCNKNYAGIIKYHCEPCEKIRRYVKLYNDDNRVLDVLDNIFSRDYKKQDNKINQIKQEEIKNLQDSIDLYPNKKDVIKELKEKIKKK